MLMQNIIEGHKLSLWDIAPSIAVPPAFFTFENLFEEPGMSGEYHNVGRTQLRLLYFLLKPVALK